MRAVATATGADEPLALRLCVTVLARRLSRRDTPVRVRLRWGDRKAVIVRGCDPLDETVSFDTALRQAAEQGVPDSSDESRVDTTIAVSEAGDALVVQATTDSADTAVALCWARSLLHLLRCVTDDPAAPLAAHALVDAAERDRILYRLNLYRRPRILHRTLAGPFEEQVQRTPDGDALVDENGRTLSYRQLNERANRLAHFLRADGAGAGTRVGICMTRGVDQVVAIYAAVKTGAAYVPIDAELPDARLAYMLDDSAPRHVLTDAACRERVPAGAWRVLDLDADRASWGRCPAMDLQVGGSAADLVHILYTSGTTGLPKGVAYPSDAALANIEWMQREYPFRAGDSAVFKTSPGFDVSIWELFWPLYHGGRLVVCRPGGHRDPAHLARVVERYAVTTIFFVPTVVTPFLEAVSAERAGALRWALCGGESMSPRLRDRFHATLPATTLVNAFGPTEAGPVTDNVIPHGMGGSVVPVGRPAANFRIHVLDENLDPVPVGMPGEAYIGGEIALAHGYWRAAARTAERFVADPYGPPGARMYRTGDLCRYRDDGLLEHLGRIDRQIKVRGLRVEPGEIEAVLAAHPAVGDCAVVGHDDPVRLLAFVAPAGAAGITEEDLQSLAARAAAVLPEHMRPEQIVPVDRIPATMNGKVDRDALLGAWREQVDRAREIVAPADGVEAALVDIYRMVLQTESVSVLDTFVQLGGHSLLAFRLLDECGQRLGHEPAVTDLLFGTLRQVAASIRAAGQVSDVYGRQDP
ncbi:amino acid adenylation protein [Micromonospora echinospora]|nr:amino acid adenylation protein [Micromonospora echinospora]